MTVLFSMSSQTTFDLFGNAISSPASAAGLTPSNSPDGQKTGKSGLEARHANPSLWRDREKRITTTETSGPLFTVSSPSADLQSSLASRLAASLDINGSPEFALSWSEMDIGLGPRISRLVASARRTAGSGSTGAPWLTPNATGDPEGMGSKASYKNHTTMLHHQVKAAAPWPTPGSDEGGGGKSTHPASGGMSFATAVKATAWPTPVKQDGANTRNATANRLNPMSAHHAGETLLDAVTAAWPTPRPSRDGAMSLQADTALKRVEKFGYKGRIEEAVAMAAWATPASRDWRSANGSPERKAERLAQPRGKGLEEQASGTMPNGGSGQTERPGALNPAFVCWLMGYPTAWVNCADSVTRSSRRSPRCSSKP